MEKSNQEQIDELLGYGKKLRVFIGVNEDGKENIKEYHFTPVAMKDIPKMGVLLDSFLNAANKGSFNEDAINKAAEIIQMSTKRVHPELTIDEIKKLFTLGILAKAVKIVMDINDFFSEMQAIMEVAKVAAVNPQLKP